MPHPPCPTCSWLRLFWLPSWPEICSHPTLWSASRPWAPRSRPRGKLRCYVGGTGAAHPGCAVHSEHGVGNVGTGQQQQVASMHRCQALPPAPSARAGQPPSTSQCPPRGRADRCPRCPPNQLRGLLAPPLCPVLFASQAPAISAGRLPCKLRPAPPLALHGRPRQWQSTQQLLQGTAPVMCIALGFPDRRRSTGPAVAAAAVSQACATCPSACTDKAPASATPPAAEPPGAWYQFPAAEGRSKWHSQP